jgi:nicotinamide N-methyltransferase
MSTSQLQAPQNPQLNLDSDSDPESTLSIFTDPPDYYPPSPKPTTETQTLLSGKTITLSLVGHNPLWGHHLWNAGRVIATYLEKNPSFVKDQTVLELGAGAGLPSLVARVLGARKVVVTDYPDPDLISNLWANIERLEGNLWKDDNGKKGSEEDKKIVAEGYCWGGDPFVLLSHPKSRRRNFPS